MARDDFGERVLVAAGRVAREQRSIGLVVKAPAIIRAVVGRVH